MAAEPTIPEPATRERTMSDWSPYPRIGDHEIASKVRLGLGVDYDGD